MSAAKPSMRFYHSVALRTRTEKLLAAIDKSENPTEHARAFADLVVDLSEAGMEYYFLKPIRQAKFGIVAQKTASLGMSGALRVLSPIVRTILHGATAAQLKVIAEHMRHLTQ